MALIRNRADLILAAAMIDNPTFPAALNYSNCYVYKYGSYSSKKGFCFIKGRYGKGIRGKLRVRYAKLDIDVLLREVERKVYFSGAATVVDLLPSINARFGFDLTPTDVVVKPVAPDGKSVVLEIASASTLYRGTVTLSIAPAHANLELLVTERQLDPTMSYWPLVERQNGNFLSIGHDYTEVGDQLSGYSSGVLTDPVGLAVLLNRVDNVPWSSVPSTIYSLSQANVLYNGSSAALPTELSPLLRALFDSVLVLEINQTTNTGLSSTPIAFHYNVFH